MRSQESLTNYSIDVGTNADAQHVLLTPDQVAERHHTSTGHLANLRMRGEGPPYLKLGRSIRYRLSDVISYEASNTVVPGTITAA